MFQVRTQNIQYYCRQFWSSHFDFGVLGYSGTRLLVTRHNSNNFYVSYSLDICVVNDKILKLEIDFCSNWAGPVELDSYKSSEIEA